MLTWGPKYLLMFKELPHHPKIETPAWDQILPLHSPNALSASSALNQSGLTFESLTIQTVVLLRLQLKRMQEMLNKMQQQMHDKEQWHRPEYRRAVTPPAVSPSPRQWDLQRRNNGWIVCQRRLWLCIYLQFGALYSLSAWRLVLSEGVFLFCVLWSCLPTLSLQSNPAPNRLWFNSLNIYIIHV